MRTGIQKMKINPSLNPASARLVAAAKNRGFRQRAQTKVCRQVFLMATALALGSLSMPAQNEPAPPATSPEPLAVTNESAIEVVAPAPADEKAAAPTNAVPQPEMITSSTNGLTLNFRNAPIDLVLENLSKAAGFIIVLDSPVRGTVSVMGEGLSKDEAVNLLNSELNKNGYAAVRSGERTLKIMDKSTAKTANIPVQISNDPASVPDNDEMVTQIIPIRFVEAQSLVSDLSPFVSQQATIIANQAGNSIVITDTQSNIRHLMEIIKAIDSSAEDVTEVKVFHLQYADPTETATLLTSLFPDQNGTSQSPFRFAGRGGRGGRGGGPGAFFAAMAAGANNGGNSQQDRIKKRTQIVAVADPRSSSVIVTATQDLMEQITEMLAQLDKPGKKMRMEVIPLDNADANAVLSVLQDTVGATSSRNTRNNTSSQFQQRIQQSLNNSGSTTFGNTSSRGGSNQRGGAGGF
jgi:general secretion pathway protein D